MEILEENQYNQGIGRYKLLSSTSGAGSIVTTKVGTYVLISDINKWEFINRANAVVKNERTTRLEKDVYLESKRQLVSMGISIVDDERFVKFIRLEKKLNNLVCLINIPHMSLNETFNTPNWNNHPIKKSLAPLAHASDYMIVGSHFPKWFRGKGGHLRKISQWFDMWKNECKKHTNMLQLKDFSPPRDAENFIGEFSKRNAEKNTIKYRKYMQLEQTNLILICPNGHLSDIPWANYLRWKTDKVRDKSSEGDNGEYLLENHKVGPCCSKPGLKWSENKTKSDGYGSIYLHCENCGLGTGGSEKPKVNLEGINNIEPYCIGEKPWEIEKDGCHFDNIRRDDCYTGNDKNNKREKMKVALVTANNIYYANGFSSLFIPMHLATEKSEVLIGLVDTLNTKYNLISKNKEISKSDFWANRIDEDFDEFVLENNFPLPEELEILKQQVRTEFLNENQFGAGVDTYVEYRWQEYRCFSKNSSLTFNNSNNGLCFSDIDMPIDIGQYFKKIKQVESLKITNIQLDFTRVKPKERIVVQNEIVESSVGQNIFSSSEAEVFVLPAVENYGEGLFFEFSEESIVNWISRYHHQLNDRFDKYIKKEPNRSSQGFTIKNKIFLNGLKYFLIHSFSHMIMRELEFSCGYQTASLKERLYISTNNEKAMNGVLIYTVEGAEGSMGGLVSQGEPDKLLEIIKNGLAKTMDCSSDPLCWESEGQGLFDLNLSACFSCSLVAETACEEMNLGLDRRVLVDEEFGYFKDLIYTL